VCACERTGSNFYQDRTSPDHLMGCCCCLVAQRAALTSITIEFSLFCISSCAWVWMVFWMSGLCMEWVKGRCWVPDQALCCCAKAPLLRRTSAAHLAGSRDRPPPRALFAAAHLPLLLLRVMWAPALLMRVGAVLAAKAIWWVGERGVV